MIATPKNLVVNQPEARLQDFGNLERAPVLAAGQAGKLRRQHIEGIGDRERHHGEEDRLHPERKEADRERQRQRQHSSGDEPQQERAPARAQRVEHETDAIGADAEEHDVSERNNARIAEQEIVGCDEQDHHAGLGGDVERLRAVEQERRPRQCENDENEQDLQRAPARRIARENAHRPLTG